MTISKLPILQHAIVWTDHQHADVVVFNGEQSETRKLRAHTHPTGQHGSSVRSEHEFMAALCTAIEVVPQVLVTGSKQVLADFRHYVEKHRPQAGQHIVAYEVAAPQTEGQRLAFARKYFLDRETLAPKASA